MNQGTNKLNTINDSGAGSVRRNGGRINKNIGKDADASMEANDTYPVDTMVSTATARQKGNTVGNSAISIPPSVATPLPPLNPPNIV